MRRLLLALAPVALFLVWLVFQVRQHPTQVPKPSPLYVDSLVESLSDLEILKPEEIKALEHSFLLRIGSVSNH